MIARNQWVARERKVTQDRADIHSASGSGENCASSGAHAGRKNFAQLFYFFTCLRMVSALLPLAISNLAICCEYQTSDLSGRFNGSLSYTGNTVITGWKHGAPKNGV
jgi:hypothetical protein